MVVAHYASGIAHVFLLRKQIVRINLTDNSLPLLLQNEQFLKSLKNLVSFTILAGRCE
jgi:hypothetical protein